MTAGSASRSERVVPRIVGVSIPLYRELPSKSSVVSHSCEELVAAFPALGRLAPIMSNSQWPQNNSPWSSQDPHWRPSEFQDAKGRDPRAPFGQAPTPDPGGYQDLEPPRRPNPTLFIVLGAIVLIGGIVVGMQVLGGSAPETQTATPSASAPASVEPTTQRPGTSIPFEGNGNGTFEILSARWNGDSLTARIRVEVQEGEYGFSVFAFSNASRASYDPVDAQGFSVRAGQPYEADVTFEMPNTDSTIVLATASGRTALNALPVKAG